MGSDAVRNMNHVPQSARKSTVRLPPCKLTGLPAKGKRQWAVSKSSLKNAFGEIEALSYADLRASYEEVFGRAPPRLSRDLLRRTIAYEIQADRFGGLPRRVEKLLRADSSPSKRNSHQQLLPGTQLVREWEDEMQLIDVLENGFQWHGKHFGSLSAVARAITGTRWSGPRFFGLTESTNK